MEWESFRNKLNFTLNLNLPFKTGEELEAAVDLLTKSVQKPNLKTHQELLDFNPKTYQETIRPLLASVIVN